MSLLHRILEVAVDDGTLARNPATGVTIRPEAKTDKRIFTRDEAMKMLAAVAAPDRVRRGPEARRRQPWVMCMVMLWAGLRWGEVLGVRVRDVNLLKRRLSVVQVVEEVSGKTRVKEYPKTDAGRRTVPMTEALARALEQHVTELGLRPGDLLFTTTTGGSMTRSSFRSWVWQPALVQAGLATWTDDRRTTIEAVASADGELLPLPTPHSLRHSYISWLANAGNVPLDTVRRMAGHESILTTQQYLHAVEGEEEQVLAGLEGAPARPRALRPVEGSQDVTHQ
ncbi:site-specific integrase [Humibacter sp.]|uniref:tyrosine-type recombinase/integrase n=1 Tax=Humibacter sp. TaxID=1940291 RepID=UPI002C5046B2|nr:site-specific integrase [Humibacter sp.]HVX09197.1 site-specific integrase [Humibacter sp.]